MLNNFINCLFNCQVLESSCSLHCSPAASTCRNSPSFSYLQTDLFLMIRWAIFGMKQGAIAMHPHLRQRLGHISSKLILSEKIHGEYGFSDERRVSRYVCDTHMLFQESDLPMRTALVSHVPLLLCPGKEMENWKSALCGVSVASWQPHYLNSRGLFLHAVSFNVNKGSWHIWKIKGIFSTVLFYAFLFSIIFPQDRGLTNSGVLLLALFTALPYIRVPMSWIKC